MAGHSKWANIKHKKAAVDAKRGKIFTRLSKEITVAAKSGGGDTSANPRLRTLVEKAREANMPMDNITRAIKKGTGELPGVSYDAITYEGYAPNNVAVIVECLTDNKNRTVADLRKNFSKHGGTLGESGSVSWMFEQKGVLKGETEKSEDELLELLMDFEVDTLEKKDGHFYITCEIKALENVKSVLKNKDIKIDSSEIEWVAKSSTEINDDQVQKVIDFLELIEDLDDVQSVYSSL